LIILQIPKGIEGKYILMDLYEDLTEEELQLKGFNYYVDESLGIGSPFFS